MSKKTFQRRIYHSPAEFFRDFRFIMGRRNLIRETMQTLIPADFRERLMLAVTEVNGCRYCSYYHAKMALEAGMDNSELQQFLKGLIPPSIPQDELPAVLYAQHWAETNAQPSLTAQQRLVENYGQQKATAIHIILRMIRMGNLLGNTWDFLLYKLSFGNLGLRENESSYS